MKALCRADVWLVDLDPVVGHEQGGMRPAMIISVDLFNESATEDVFVVPITSKHRAIRSRVHVAPPEGGLVQDSYLICEKTRSLSQQRLKKRLGRVSDNTLQQVEQILRHILGF